MRHAIFFGFIFWLVVIAGAVNAFAGQATQVGVVGNYSDMRVNFQSLKRSDANKLYVNTDVYNPDTKETSTATRLLGHVGYENYHLAAQGTFAKGYTRTLVGVGYDIYRRKLLGVDIGVDNKGNLGGFAYWGAKYGAGISSDGFIDVDGYGNIASRANVMVHLIEGISAGYEAEVKNEHIDHNLKLRWVF